MGTFASNIAKLQESEHMPHYQTIKRAVEERQPPVEILQVQKDKDTGTEVTYTGRKTVKEDTENLETVFTEAKMKVSYC